MSMNERETIDASKTMEKKSEKIEPKMRKIKVGKAKQFITFFDTFLDNLLEESRQMASIPLEKSINRNSMTGTKQPVQILLPTTEIGGAVK